jgi:NAD(P)-dependent dehydrogenase (short-subunit alcohol dehydrogenase family)
LVGIVLGEFMGKLDGKIAVITGGNSGIGLATAKRFVQEGAYVFITGRTQAKLDEAVKQVGSNVTGVQGDVAKLDDLDRLYEQIKKEKGKLDIVFANAGIAKYRRSAASMNSTSTASLMAMSKACCSRCRRRCR